jgi:hypothetical protein
MARGGVVFRRHRPLTVVLLGRPGSLTAGTTYDEKDQDDRDGESLIIPEHGIPSI